MIDPKMISVIKVAEFHSVTKAAEALALTQPAVTQHIRYVEEELGCPLFVRGRSEMVLTKGGEIYVHTAKRVIAMYENMRAEIREGENRIRSLTIGVTHTAESNAIAETLAVYANRMADFPVRIITEESEKLKAMLRNYELDFIISDNRAEKEGFKSEMLDTDSLVLVVSPDHKLAKKNAVTFNALQKEKMILRHQASNTMKLFEAALASHNMVLSDLNVIMELDNIATIKDLVRANLGTSVLAKSACAEEIRKKKLVALPITDLSMEREIRIFYQEDFAHPEIIKDIREIYEKIKKDGKKRLLAEEP